MFTIQQTARFFHRSTPITPRLARLTRAGLALTLAGAVLSAGLPAAEAAPQSAEPTRGTITIPKAPTPTATPTTQQKKGGAGSQTSTANSQGGLLNGLNAKPDLVASLDLNGPFYAGEKTEFCYGFTNKSSADVNDPFKTKLTVSDPQGNVWEKSYGSFDAHGDWGFCAKDFFAAGTHTVTFAVDFAGSVEESSESNNSVSMARTWLPARPDLLVTKMEIEGKDPWGNSDCDPGKNAITAIVYNEGQGESGGFVARLLIDGEEKGDEEIVQSLSSGQQTVLVFNKIKMKKGDHSVQILLDADNALNEVHEDNNGDVIPVSCVNEDL